MKQGQAFKKKPAGQKRRPGQRPKKQQSKGGQGPKQTLSGKKRKAAAPPPQPAAAAVAGGGDDFADDFGELLDGMEDYKPGQDADDGGSEPDLEQVAAGVVVDGGSDEELGSDEEHGQKQEGQDQEGGGKKAKKRRKRGQKLSAMEFEASRQMAKQIAECSAEEQADWLWASYQQHAAASALERGGLTAGGMAPLPSEGSLEQRLKALAPSTWQQGFCNQAAGKQQRQQQQAAPPGSPALLLVSPSAMGSVNLIKLCPQFQRACKIGKLFAKHMKVPEQEANLRSQVMCIAAGTPNRLCKLADSGALQLERLRHVVLDVQLDVKQRDILAIPETRADWWQFYDRHLSRRLEAGTLKLSLINSDHLGNGSS